MPHDDPHELFYLVDQKDRILGKITRKEAHRDISKIHRAVYVLIVNHQDEMLFQKRSQHKDLYKGYWALGCAGHVTYGETYRQAAVHEVYEELKIFPQLFYVTKLTVKTEGEAEMVEIYLAKIKDTPKHFDHIEIDELKWVPIKDIPSFVAKQKLPPADIEVLKLLMYLKN